MLEMDLNVACNFFKYGRTKTMPVSVMEPTLRGTCLVFNNLETGVLEWKNLRDIFSKKIANKIPVLSEGTNIPYLRRHKGPIYYVYNPGSGEYVGKFDMRKVKI